MIRTFHIPLNLDLNRRGSRRSQTIAIRQSLIPNLRTISLIYVGQKKKAKRTIIYSKIYLRVRFQLIFIFQCHPDKYSITLLT